MGKVFKLAFKKLALQYGKVNFLMGKKVDILKSKQFNIDTVGSLKKVYIMEKGIWLLENLNIKDSFVKD